MATAKANKARPQGYQTNAHDARMWREVTTPEGAVIRLRLADAGERAGALFIDAGIMLVTLIVGGMIIAFGVPDGYFGDWSEVGQILFNLFFFILRAFYFTIFEMGRRAATPGKRIMKLRVVAGEGRQLTANAVFARNVMRELEVFLPFTFLLTGMGGDTLNGMMTLLVLVWLGVFVFMPVFNRDKLRGGDLVAGTWVIRNPKPELAKDVTSTSANADDVAFVFTQEQLQTYGEHELQVLEDVLRSGTGEVKAAVASRIRARIGWEAAPLERDGPFLEAFYKQLRKTLETRMLFGNRKKDKYDTGESS